MAAASRPIVAFPRPEDIFSRLEKEPVAPVYLFHGDESYLIDQAVTQVRRRTGNSQGPHTFYAGDDSLDALLETWGAPSLFTRQSLIMLRNAERLKAVERERLAKEAELRDAAQPLVVCAHGRVDLTQKFFALCAKRGFVAEFRPPFANQIPGWVQRFARERGVRLNEEAVHLLSDLIGPNLLVLATEIDKLVAFVFPGTEISADTVTACAGNLHKHSAFDLADALGQRDKQKALGLLRQVLVDEREALPVLHALMSHFRRLWQVKELLDSRTPEEQIERAVGLRGLRLRALIGQSQSYTAADLRRLLRRAAALDLTLKSTRISPPALFDALILDVCTRPA